MYNPFMPNTSALSRVAYAAGDSGGELSEAEKIAAAKAKEEAAAAAKAAAKATADAQAAATQAGSNNLMEKSMTDPGSLVQSATVANIDPNTTGTTLADNTGQVAGALPTIAGATPTPASTIDPTNVSSDIAGLTDSIQAVQGSVSDDATVQAATLDPTQLAQTNLQADQLGAAQTVAAPVDRTVGAGELVQGSSVDMAQVDAALDIKAQQADPTTQATVQGQLSELMSDFDGKAPPAWAAGALRNATAQMAARGLGASSMAGQALVQAAMESALPIAMADASTFAQFESQNLSNRQQTAMFAAQQRASFMEMDFNQGFQTRVANAAKISDIANMNFTAGVQIALENASMAQTVDLTNLSARNAKMMSDAAALTAADMTNLNNRQQARVMNAQSFLSIDMKNMDLQQQSDQFEAQATIDAMFSDQSAANASAQFNASSENQTNQFFANMQLQVDQYNSGVAIDRDKFNAQNALVVRQANAQWRQNSTTINTSAQNTANAQTAATTNALSASMIETVWQRERDLMDFSFRSAESATDRALSVFLGGKQDDLQRRTDKSAKDAAAKEAKGYLLNKILFG